MKKKPSKLMRILSLNQHRKRWGARNLTTKRSDFTDLKVQIIGSGTPKQTRGSSKSIEQHLTNLRQEFSGQPELLCHHAQLIVLIRREFKQVEHYAKFRELWNAEGDFLRKNLNSRWLVSAVDTFAEHDGDPTVRAVAMMTSVLVNSVKMYESERYITNDTINSIDPERVAILQEKLVPLFDGMSCFTVGTDDTLRNMVWRLEPFMSVQPAGPIFHEIWRRLQKEDTVFSRMDSLHKRDKTRWSNI